MKIPPWPRIILFILCSVPFAQLITNAFTGNLGANPIDAITRHTGSWALLLLLATLSVTPLRKIFGWNGLVRYRRMAGLFAFFYAALHFLTYLVLDHFFDFGAIVKDVMKRPYVTAGFTGFVLMIPLALTSTTAMIRRLGSRWRSLHRLVYISALAGVIHFYWLVKADIRRPVQYGSALALLLGYRLYASARTGFYGAKFGRATPAGSRRVNPPNSLPPQHSVGAAIRPFPKRTKAIAEKEPAP